MKNPHASQFYGHGDQMLGPDYEKARAAYDAMKAKARKWRERGCSEKAIGVLLVDENEATGGELSRSQLRAIQIGVMVPRKTPALGSIQVPVRKGR